MSPESSSSNNNGRSNTRQISGKQRRKYQVITDDKRKDIIKYWEDNHCNMTGEKMSQVMRISRTTLNSIIKVYITDGRTISLKRGGNSHRRATTEQIAAIKELIDKDPTITLRSIQERITAQFSLDHAFSISGIDYILKNEI